MYVGQNAFACTIDFRSKLNYILPQKQCNTWIAKLNKRINVNPIDINAVLVWLTNLNCFKFLTLSNKNLTYSTKWESVCFIKSHLSVFEGFRQMDLSLVIHFILSPYDDIPYVYIDDSSFISKQHCFTIVVNLLTINNGQY